MQDSPPCMGNLLEGGALIEKRHMRIRYQKKKELGRRGAREEGTAQIWIGGREWETQGPRLYGERIRGTV